MAVEVNLLPWREELREKQKKTSIGFLAAAFILAVALSGLYYMHQKLTLEDLNQANNKIKTANTKVVAELKALDELKKKKELLNNQVKSIESLQAKRGTMTHLLDELSKMATLTNNADNEVAVFISSFAVRENDVSIDGVSKNDAHVAKFMRDLESSDWYQGVELREIRSIQNLGEEIKTFSIVAKVSEPEPDSQNTNN